MRMETPQMERRFEKTSSMLIHEELWSFYQESYVAIWLFPVSSLIPALNFPRKRNIKTATDPNFTLISKPR